MTTLVVAAHPDDETLGAGGTTARLTRSGEEVSWLILGEGSTSREGGADPGALAIQAQECARAASRLGVSDVERAGLPDNRFDSVDLLDVVHLVERTIARVRPHTVLTHHRGDANVDHRITHDSVLAATRPVPGSSIRTVLAFEVVSSTEWAFDPAGSFNPGVFVDITDTIEDKVHALAAYESEMRIFPHPRSPEVVRAQAVGARLDRRRGPQPKPSNSSGPSAEQVSALRRVGHASGRAGSAASRRAQSIV